MLVEIVGGLLKQGLDWDWTGTGLGLDWAIYNIVHSCESLVALNTSCEHVLQWLSDWSVSVVISLFFHF